MVSDLITPGAAGPINDLVNSVATGVAFALCVVALLTFLFSATRGKKKGVAAAGVTGAAVLGLAGAVAASLGLVMPALTLVSVAGLLLVVTAAHGLPAQAATIDG